MAEHWVAAHVDDYLEDLEQAAQPPGAKSHSCQPLSSILKP